MRELLVGGRIDLAVLSAVEPPSGLHCTALLSEQMVLVGPLASRLSMQRPVSAESLVKHPLIVTPPRNSLRILVERAVQRSAKHLSATIEVTLAELILDLVEREQGYSVLPYCAIDQAIKSQRLRAAPIRKLRISWVVAMSKERPHTVAQRRFAETLKRLAFDQIRRGAWPTAKLTR